MKLKRPRGYEASKYQLPVMVGNTEYTIANLQKSGVTNQSVVLFGYQDVWHEIEIHKFAATANLDAFKLHIESKALTLEQLGVIEANPDPKSIDEMNHEHYERLESMFPGYDYHMISKLHKHYSRYTACPFMELKLAMQRISEKKMSIDEWIAQSLDAEKSGSVPKPPVENHYIMNDSGVIINPDTDYEYLECGANVKLWTGRFKDGTWGNGLHISSGTKEGVVYPVSVQMKSPSKDKALQSVYSRSLYVMKGLITMGAENLNTPFNEIQNLLNIMTKQLNPIEQAAEVPATPLKEEIATLSEYAEEQGDEYAEEQETEGVEGSAEAIEQPKRPLSITVIGGLQPEKIQEFKDIKKNQEKIVKANPFVPVKDKESLEKARIAARNLLKASTTLDSPKTGLGKITKDALNLLKKMTDKFIEETAAITRTPYDKQQKEIDEFVHKEELRIAAEREAELKRVKDRTDMLYAVPMTFNGEVYSVGNVYILPSQINEMSDEEFNKLVEQVRIVATAERAKADADKSLAEENERLRRELAILKGEVIEPVSEIPTPEPVAELEVRTVEGLQQYAIPDSPAATPVIAPVAASTAPAAQTSQYPYGYEPGTELTPPNSKPLKDFDTAHSHVLAMQPIPAPFIKCREYFRMGTVALATEIDAIMKSTPVEGQPTKPEQIKSLIASILE